MRLYRLAWMLVIIVLESSAFHLPAQEAAIETNKWVIEIKAKAEAGDADAQFRLGHYFYEVSRDASLSGNILFKNGNGDASFLQAYKDYDVQAYKWLCLAATHTNFSLAADARRDLVSIFPLPELTPEKIEKAKELVREVAPDAVAKVEADIAADDRKQFETDKSGAESGNSFDQWKLGLDYQSGLGVPKDSVKAANWYRRSAMQGDSSGENSLGWLYVEGTGIPKNYVEAYKWLNLAAAQEAINAKQNRDSVARKMTPEQIAVAQRLSVAFVPRKETPGSNSDNSASPANPSFTGTGFFITDDGYLISNYHVVKGAAKVRLLTGLRRAEVATATQAGAGLIDATVVKVDAANDLALLKAVGRFAPLPIAASRTVKLGGTVATVGFPDIGLQGFAPKLAKGEIASLAGAADDPRYFQISLPVQPGNSGGALVDARGNVVGIVAAKLDASAALAATGSLPENVNYAVKSSLLLSFLESVPDVAAKLKEPNTKDESFEEVVKSAQSAAVLVLVY